MTTALWIGLCSFTVSIVFASFFEWALHRWLMHGVLFKGYPYRKHDQVHHVVFDSDAGYHLRDQEHRTIVTMAWWNAPVLMFVNLPLPGLIALWLGSWSVVIGAMSALLAYYAMYEYFHWCMHVPSARWFQNTRLFRGIDRHHRIHHLDPSKNLNVVLPIADLVLRTRLRAATQTS